MSNEQHLHDLFPELEPSHDRDAFGNGEAFWQENAKVGFYLDRVNNAMVDQVMMNARILRVPQGYAKEARLLTEIQMWSRQLDKDAEARTEQEDFLTEMLRTLSLALRVLRGDAGPGGTAALIAAIAGLALRVAKYRAQQKTQDRGPINDENPKNFERKNESGKVSENLKP
jgi:hypothetical protein